MEDSGSTRACSAELDLEAGSYSILVKITAYRVDDFATAEELIRKYRKSRRQKLLQVGANYDATHSKGRLRELEIANVERARGRAKEKSRMEMMREREARRKERMLDKLKNKRIKEEEKRKRAEVRKAKRAARREKSGIDVIVDINMIDPGDEAAITVSQVPRAREQRLAEAERQPVDNVTDAPAEAGIKPVDPEENKQPTPAPAETLTPVADTCIPSSTSEPIKTPNASSSDPDAPRPEPEVAAGETTDTAAPSQASPPKKDTMIVEASGDMNARSHNISGADAKTGDGQAEDSAPTFDASNKPTAHEAGDAIQEVPIPPTVSLPQIPPTEPSTTAKTATSTKTKTQTAPPQ